MDYRSRRWARGGAGIGAALAVLAIFVVIIVAALELLGR
jgi:hypothetical protein